MPLPKLSVTGLDNENQRRRLPETINGILTHQFDDSRVQTSAEKLAGVTPVNYAFPPGDFRRYGGIDDGATDNTALIVSIITSFGDSFSGMFYAPPNLLFNFTTVTAAIGGTRYVLRDESLINAHNTSGFRQKMAGFIEGGDPTAVHDFSYRISSGHNATIILDNRGTSGSTSGDNGIAMVQWTRGELTIGQPDPRDLARYEFGAATSTKWWWIIRRAAPWEARTWEYWAQGQSISGAGVYRRTATGYYVSTGSGTTGSTEPSHTTGTVSDGGVSWTVVLPNIDSGIFSVDQWGQIATNTSPLDGNVAYLKSDKYGPGGGTASVYIEADGSSKTADIRLRPTDGAGAADPVPYFIGQSGVGMRLSHSSGINSGEFARVSNSGGLQLAAYGLLEGTASNGDTTPSVKSIGSLILANTSATSITALDDGLPTQEVCLIFENGNTTLVHNASTFILKGAANVTPTQNQMVTMKKYTNTSAWIEKSRNF